MFEPGERHSFLDLVRPPAGYRLDAAVLVTYSLDFVALTAMFLALVDREAEGEGAPENDAETLQAITRLSHRVRVFVNRGQIAAGGLTKAFRVLSLYDNTVCEVCQTNGRFHPKAWVARYVPRQCTGMTRARPLVRLGCSSRNLTTSNNWEAFACLEGEEKFRFPRPGIGADAAAFFRQCRGSR
jgi:hypothetical protein